MVLLALGYIISVVGTSDSSKGASRIPLQNIHLQKIKMVLAV